MPSSLPTSPRSSPFIPIGVGEERAERLAETLASVEEEEEEEEEDAYLVDACELDHHRCCQRRGWKHWTKKMRAQKNRVQ